METNNSKFNFYTHNGWAGSNYDQNLTAKEIAVKIRSFLKKEFPAFKFSVRSKWGMQADTIYITIQSGPVQALMPNNPHSYESSISGFGRAYESRITPEMLDVCSKIENFVNTYRHSDCDGMEDYFDVNFYCWMYIGDYEHPYKVAENFSTITSSKNSDAYPAIDSCQAQDLALEGMKSNLQNISNKKQDIDLNKKKFALTVANSLDKKIVFGDYSKGYIIMRYTSDGRDCNDNVQLEFNFNCWGGILYTADIYIKGIERWFILSVNENGTYTLQENLENGDIVYIRENDKNIFKSLNVLKKSIGALSFEKSKLSSTFSSSVDSDTAQLPDLSDLEEVSRAAYRLQSQDPDERGAELLARQQRQILDDLAQLPEPDRQEYITEYRALLIAWLQAMARVASPLVVGPASFPVRRNDKAQQAADRAADRLNTFRSRTMSRAKRRRPAA